jgi:hypothetical protein
MKAFFEIMRADYRSEGFSRAEWVKFGFIAPIVLILICGLCHG